MNRFIDVANVTPYTLTGSRPLKKLQYGQICNVMREIMNPNNAEIALQTKESICAAAAQLLISNKDITVTSICRAAGVSRNAFYRNFESIDDVFIYHLIVGWAKYADQYKVAEGPQAEVMKHLIRYFFDEKEYILSLKRHSLVHLVEQLFVKVIVPQDSTGATRYTLYGTAYFTYGMIRAMIDSNFSDAPDEIEKMFRQKAQS
jgi:AcrR family transcriptional regulator